MSDKPSPARLRAQKLLLESFSGESEIRAGVVVLSYRLPGAGDESVSFAHASGARTADGLIDFVMLAKTLRQIADQLDRVVKDPKGAGDKLQGVQLR